MTPEPTRWAVIDPETGDCIETTTDPATDRDRIRAEYQRFYDFVADADPAIVDAWHFTENSRRAAT